MSLGVMTPDCCYFVFMLLTSSLKLAVFLLIYVYRDIVGCGGLFLLDNFYGLL